MTSCVFGSSSHVRGTIETAATMFNMTHGSCTSPAWAEGELVPVSVKQFSVNDTSALISSTDFFFAYQSIVAVHKIMPSSGSVLGGSRVRIFGSGFKDSPDEQLLVNFGGVVVPADFVSFEEII